MAFRKRMSKQKSRRSFRKHSRSHKKNQPHRLTRGGFRM